MVAWSEEFNTPYAPDWGPDWDEVDATDTDYSVDESGAGVLEFTSGSSYAELSKDAPDILDSSHWRLTSRFTINRIPAGEMVEVGFLPGGWDGPAAWVDAYRNPGGPSQFIAEFLGSHPAVDLSTWQRNVWHFMEIDCKAGRSVEWRLWASGEARPAEPMIEEPSGPFEPVTDTFDRTEDPGWGDAPADWFTYAFGDDDDAKVEDGFAKLEFPSGSAFPQMLPSGTLLDAYPLPYSLTFLGQFTPALAAEATLLDNRGRGVSWYPDGTLRVSTVTFPGPTFGSPTDDASGLDMEAPTWVKVEFTATHARIKAWADGDSEPGWAIEFASAAAGSNSAPDLILGLRTFPTLPLTGGWWTDTFTFDPGSDYGVLPALDPIIEVEGFATDAGGEAQIDWIRIANRPDFDIGGGSCDSPMPFDVYDIGTATFPELTYVGTLCSAYDKVIRKEADGLGSGNFKINRYQADGTWNPEVSADILGAGIAGTPRLVIPRIPEAADDEGVFGFFLTSGDFKLIDPGEHGGEVLEFGGPGLVSYTGWGVMDATSYITVPFIGEQPYDRTWHLYADSSITTVLLAYGANGTDATLTSWQLPSINPSGDDLLLVGFYQVRPIRNVSSAGWTARIHEDTAGLDGGTGFGEYRYGVLDQTVDVGAPPYADTLAADGATRWSTAQVALRRLAGMDPVQSAGDWSAGGGAKTATFGAPVTAGNALLAYATFTSGGSGTPVFDWPDGFTEILRIPGQNSMLGVAAVAYKEADGSETDVQVLMTDDPASLTGGVVLAAEYPLVPIVMQPAGAILWRVVRELQEPDRPSHPIPLLSMDFDYAVDSNGNAWQPTPATAQFQAQVGEPVDSVIGRLLGTGAVGIKVKVDSTGIRLSAYNRDAFGTDRTGTDFATGVVRFERAVNIGSASRKMVTGQLATHSLVQGDGDLYGRAVIDGADDFPHRESFLAAGSQTDVAALNDMGVADLLQRLIHGESVAMPVAVGDDEAAGLYLPFKHYDAGDRVTVKTGDGDQDFDDETFSIAAITISEPRGAVAASDLQVILELGSTIQVGSMPSSGGSYSGGGIISSPGGGSGSTHDPVSLTAEANAILGLAGQQLGLDDQAANRVFAGPAAGGDAKPTMRALVDADIPAAITRDAEAAAAYDGIGAAAAVASDLAAHLADAVDAHDASAVSFVPTGTIAATNVQSAIAEVAAEAGGGTPAADPGDIADPTIATAQDVAEKLNDLMAAMRTAGSLV